jgi:succinate dehydrogenase / fumarate reductase cytochrome b subunit
MTRRLARLFGRGGDLNPRNMRLGIWAWLIQRASGIVLVAFVVAHAVAISQASFALRGPLIAMLDGLRNPFYYVDRTFLFIDIVMLGIIAFHGMNGIRIVLFDTGIGVGLRSHKVIFWILIAVAVLASGLVIYYGLPLLGGALQ